MFFHNNFCISISIQNVGWISLMKRNDDNMLKLEKNAPKLCKMCNKLGWEM